MSKPVTREEWQQFKARQLSAAEMIDVSRRMKEFGLEEPITPDAREIVSQIAPVDREEDVDDDRLADFVLGKLPGDQMAVIEEMRQIDPGLNDRIEAMRAAQREVEESMAMAPVPVPKVKKSPFLGIFAGVGWAAAIGCAAMLVVTMQQKPEGIEITGSKGITEELQAKLSVMEDQLRIAEENLNAVQQNREVVTTEDILGSPKGDATTRFPWLIPDGAAYNVESGTFQFSISEKGRQILTDGKIDLPEAVKSFAVGRHLEMFPDRTLVRPSPNLFLEWPDVAGGEYDVEVRDSAGTVVESIQGLKVAYWDPKTMFSVPGIYTWKLTTRDPVGVDTVKEAKFAVPTLEEMNNLLIELFTIPDPLGKAVVLAEKGFIEDAEFVLDRLLETDPENAALQSIRQSLQRP